MAKAEFFLVSEPTADNLIALFEAIKGRRATPEERREAVTEMAKRLEQAAR